ncbi:uncharacterized protein LOC142226315 [Haematobia irritans]|uniref:uncharacterized protein LOC142226315 n=1 Tax=Haematobia irritans TaxID=7368 RepID=UPI003F4FF173
MKSDLYEIVGDGIQDNISCTKYPEKIERNTNKPFKVTPLKTTIAGGPLVPKYNEQHCDLLEEAANILYANCRRNIQRSREQIKGNCNSPYLPEENAKDIISPKILKSRFVEFSEQFLEDIFFKKPKLGQVLPLKAKPDTLTNENFTYGLKYPKSESAYELMFPHKTAKEVNHEYTNGHEKYIISHNHYFPSEKIKRYYNDQFNPNATFGQLNRVDTSGRTVRECLQQSDQLCSLGKTQPLKYHPNKGNIPQKKPVTNITNPLKAQEYSLSESVGHIHKLRRKLFSRSDIDISDLKSLLQKLDKSSTGFIIMDNVFEVLRSLSIKTNQQMMRNALIHFAILRDTGESNERVNINSFCQILNIRHPMPRSPMEVSPKYHIEDTTYRLFCSDRDHKPVSNYHCLDANEKVSSDHDVIHVVDCISPSIPTQYALHPHDFELLRSKDEMQKIFNRLLGAKFDEIWKEAARYTVVNDDNSRMSINDMMKVLV